MGLELEQREHLGQGSLQDGESARLGDPWARRAEGGDGREPPGGVSDFEVTGEG